MHCIRAGSEKPILKSCVAMYRGRCTGMIPRRRFLKEGAVALLVLSILPSVNLLAAGSAAGTSEVWVNFYSQDQLQYLPQLQGKATTIVWLRARYFAHRCKERKNRPSTLRFLP